MRKPRLPYGRGAPRLVRLIALTATLAVTLVLSAGAATRAEATSSTGLLGAGERARGRRAATSSRAPSMISAAARRPSSRT